MLNIAVFFLSLAVALVSLNQLYLNAKSEELWLQLRQLWKRIKRVRK